MVYQFPNISVVERNSWLPTDRLKTPESLSENARFRGSDPAVFGSVVSAEKRYHLAWRKVSARALLLSPAMSLSGLVCSGPFRADILASETATGAMKIP